MSTTSRVIPILLMVLSRTILAAPPSHFLQPTLQLNVRVYNSSALSIWALRGAEIEAGRMLHATKIEFNWIDCVSPPLSTYCQSVPSPDDLIVRFLPKALINAGPNALGMARVLGGSGTAFIFYDRVEALQTTTRVVSSMLGRVVAHELVHLLLPAEAHSSFGLMRPLWTPENLEFGSTACAGLSSKWVELIRQEVSRRLRVEQASR